jgi:threonine aldolase
MNFASDNTAGVAPEILAALARANAAQAAMPYGNDDVTRRLTARFCEIFEREVAVFPVATGTAANALALSLVTPPYGAIFTTASSHIHNDECGAPEFFTGGAKLLPLPGRDGKTGPAELQAAYDAAGVGAVHHTPPAAVSLTNITEAGTVYSAEETAAIGAFCRRRKLAFHLDGARFANAVAATGATPAELTWKAGVDLLSFGATKNGCMAAEAVIAFNPELAASLGYRRKRAGHLFSKMRFLSAQLDAYLEDGLWLKMARHANAQMRRLHKGLAGLNRVEVLHPVEANMMFARLPRAMTEALIAGGYFFYVMDETARPRCRFVTAFSSRAAQVDGLLALARSHGAGPEKPPPKRR